MALKVSLHELPTTSTVLHNAELWPLSVTKSQTACHKFQQQILGFCWKDKVRNEDKGAIDILKGNKMLSYRRETALQGGAF